MKNFSDKHRYILFTFVIWTCVALFEYARNQIMVSGGRMTFTNGMDLKVMFVSAFIKFYVWFVLGIVVYSLFYRLRKFRKPLQIVLLILTGIVAVTVHFMIGNLLYNYYLQGAEGLWARLIDNMSSFFLSNFPMSSLNYACIILMVVAMDLNKKYQEQRLKALTLASELSQAQLENLKMQLRPHFLFNALNTIAMLVRKNDNATAVEMISGMSDLLRTTLNREETQTVSLSYELTLLKKYLAIEQSRFKEKLTIEFDISPETENVEVPNLVLQPIVENIFKHGFSAEMGSSAIEIKSHLEDDLLTLSVSNTGPHLPYGWSQEDAKGVGIRNTVSRLKNLYGPQGNFSISNMEPTGVIVKIIIPNIRHEKD